MTILLQRRYKHPLTAVVGLNGAWMARSHCGFRGCGARQPHPPAHLLWAHLALHPSARGARHCRPAENQSQHCDRETLRAVGRKLRDGGFLDSLRGSGGIARLPVWFRPTFGTRPTFDTRVTFGTRVTFDSGHIGSLNCSMAALPSVLARGSLPQMAPATKPPSKKPTKPSSIWSSSASARRWATSVPSSTIPTGAPCLRAKGEDVRARRPAGHGAAVTVGSIGQTVGGGVNIDGASSCALRPALCARIFSGRNQLGGDGFQRRVGLARARPIARPVGLCARDLSASEMLPKELCARSATLEILSKSTCLCASPATAPGVPQCICFRFSAYATAPS